MRTKDPNHGTATGAKDARIPMADARTCRSYASRVVKRADAVPNRVVRRSAAVSWRLGLGGDAADNCSRFLCALK
jgi:hypothetical protein